MQGALIILIVLIVIGVMLYLLDIKSHHHHGETSLSAEDFAGSDKEESEACCGMHALCEKIYGAAPDEIVYYDDEELDALSRKDPEDYSEEELEMLREVLSTLRAADAPGWARSLDLREIRLPSSLRDELLMLIEEASHITPE